MPRRKTVGICHRRISRRGARLSSVPTGAECHHHPPNRRDCVPDDGCNPRGNRWRRYRRGFGERNAFSRFTIRQCQFERVRWGDTGGNFDDDACRSMGEDDRHAGFGEIDGVARQQHAVLETVLLGNPQHAACHADPRSSTILDAQRIAAIEGNWPDDWGHFFGRAGDAKLCRRRRAEPRYAGVEVRLETVRGHRISPFMGWRRASVFMV